MDENTGCLESIVIAFLMLIWWMFYCHAILFSMWFVVAVSQSPYAINLQLVSIILICYGMARFLRSFVDDALSKTSKK